MTDRPLCYIAGPFNDPNPTIRRWHVDRAVLLGRLAMACGYAPVEPHTGIAAGVYGDDSDPEQRAAGMEATQAVCRALLSSPGAVLWALLRDDGSMSDGTRGEVDIARKHGNEWDESTWAEWRTRVVAEAPHLLPEWDRLAVRPDAVGEWVEVWGGYERHYGTESPAARVDRGGWMVWRLGEIRAFDHATDVKARGRAAADAALRKAGVMP